MYGIFSGGGDNNALHFSCMHFYYINTHITYNNTIIPFGKRRFFFWLKFSLLIFCWCNRAICGISTSRKNNEKVCHRTSSLVITGWWYNGNNNKNNTVEKQRERVSIKQNSGSYHNVRSNGMHQNFATCSALPFCLERCGATEADDQWYFHDCINYSIGTKYFDSIVISQRIINHNFWLLWMVWKLILSYSCRTK